MNLMLQILEIKWDEDLQKHAMNSQISQLKQDVWSVSNLQVMSSYILPSIDVIVRWISVAHKALAQKKWKTTSFLSCRWPCFVGSSLWLWYFKKMWQDGRESQSLMWYFEMIIICVALMILSRNARACAVLYPQRCYISCWGKWIR